MSKNSVKFKPYVNILEYQPQYEPLYRTFAPNYSPELSIKKTYIAVDRGSYEYEPKDIRDESPIKRIVETGRTNSKAPKISPNPSPKPEEKVKPKAKLPILKLSSRSVSKRRVRESTPKKFRK